MYSILKIKKTIFNCEIKNKNYNIRTLNAFFKEMEQIIDEVLKKIKKESSMNNFKLETIEITTDIVKVFNKNINKINDFMHFVSNIVQEEKTYLLDNSNIKDILIWHKELGNIGVNIKEDEISVLSMQEKKVIKINKNGVFVLGEPNE